jgi:large subunit ribosomal protein L9
MEVILNQNVEGIGKSGEVVKVKDGFARNFLFPKKLAAELTAGNIKNLEQEKLRKTQKLEKEKKDAEQLRDRLAGVSLTIAVLTQDKDKDKLYGSVTALEIQRALKDEGYELEENRIALEEPIKALGIYQVPLKLHPEISGYLKVWIVKK